MLSVSQHAKSWWCTTKNKSFPERDGLFFLLLMCVMTVDVVSTARLPQTGRGQDRTDSAEIMKYFSSLKPTLYYLAVEKGKKEGRKEGRTGSLCHLKQLLGEIVLDVCVTQIFVTSKVLVVQIMPLS